MRTILPLALFLAVAPGLPSCNDGTELLRAKQIEDRGELIGGPVAMADIGDFLLENDQMRVAVLNAKDSPGPGVFGGAIVDIDLRRNRLGFENAQGRDRFAESFPVANLLVPNPRKTEVKVLRDGKDGKEATIRVDGEGSFLFAALAILRKNPIVPLNGLFPALKASIRFRTDYILRPGDRHITIQTTLLPEVVPPTSCTVPNCDEKDLRERLRDRRERLPFVRVRRADPARTVHRPVVGLRWNPRRLRGGSKQAIPGWHCGGRFRVFWSAKWRLRAAHWLRHGEAGQRGVLRWPKHLHAPAQLRLRRSLGRRHQLRLLHCPKAG